MKIEKVIKILTMGATLFRLMKKYPKISLLLVIPLIFLPIYEIFIGRANMVYMGVPTTNSFNPKRFTRVFRNSSFMLGYSDYRGNPLWVTYKLTKIPKDAKKLKRPDKFESDWRTFSRVSSDDYSRSGYDRGHMAPNFAISRLYGRDAQISTFLMSNISPQKAKLNRGIWRKLEGIEVKYFTKLFDEVWVFTGPIFDKNIEKLSTSNKVEIPDAFYKIYVGVKKDKTAKALAFIIPQTVTGKEPLRKFVTTIDEIEKQTGIDFLYKLEDKLENKLESSKDITAWRLKSFE
ncbi:DNA/RNA non-specific endonuclease [hydrothermal vent metagenome]|uniref:DNA/RNA non-specific endonuclease n=1 Tax=hydrothermal vent metagenome TaxID=652676 RepID=A0A1W1EJS6_9ZZZZ